MFAEPSRQDSRLPDCLLTNFSMLNKYTGVLSFTTIAGIASRARLGMCGWLVLTRSGLSPGKKRQAKLDALTFGVSGAKRKVEYPLESID